MKTNLLILLLVLCGQVLSQKDSTDRSWMLYPGNKVSVDSNFAKTANPSENFEGINDSSVYFDPATSLDFDNPKKGQVTVSKDSRIDALVEFLSTPKESKPVQIDGFRIQIFFDQDRNKVLGEKTRFLSMTKETKAYMEWDAPNHYVRVGNFYTRQQALAYIEKLKGAFPSATVVKSKIDLPEFE